MTLPSAPMQSPGSPPNRSAFPPRSPTAAVRCHWQSQCTAPNKRIFRAIILIGDQPARPVRLFEAADILCVERCTERVGVGGFVGEALALFVHHDRSRPGAFADQSLLPHRPHPAAPFVAISGVGLDLDGMRQRPAGGGADHLFVPFEVAPGEDASTSAKRPLPCWF
jgi:hypothetical protein